MTTLQQERANEIVEILSNQSGSSFLEYDKALELQNELKQIYKVYAPFYESSFYLNFLKDKEDFSFETNSPQSCNHPFVYTLFTVETQHIQGNSLEHCIDCYLKGIVSSPISKALARRIDDRLK